MTEKLVSLNVHRCVWCGDEVVLEPSSLNIKKEISIICIDCLDWMINEGAVVITRVNLERSRELFDRKICKEVKE